MIAKLRRKFVFVTMTCVTLILFIVFGVLCYSSYHRMDTDTQQTLERALMDDRKEPEVPKLEFGKDKEKKEPDSHHTSFTVYTDASGQILSIHSFNVEVDQTSLQTLIQTLFEQQRIQGVLTDQELRYQMKQTTNGYTIAFVDISSNHDDMMSLLFTCMIAGAGAFIAFLILSILLSNWALRPVEKAWMQQKQFVADASHELKTPITVILANSDILLSHPQDTIEEQKKWMLSIQQEAQRMKKLVENLLFLAKKDAHKLTITFTKLNFSDIIWSCILPFESIAYEQGIHLHSEIDPNLYLLGEESQLKQLMMIFLDNACKYTPKKGKIDVLLKQHGDNIICTIHNTGSYITKEELPHIFERFYRCDKSRLHEGGYGLGLSIAKTILDAHHAQIQVTSNELEGTSFHLLFPIYHI